MKNVTFVMTNIRRGILFLCVLLAASGVWGQALLQHPRLLFTKAEEPEVKRLIQTDPLAGQLAALLKLKADSLLEVPEIPYEMDKYGNMLYVARGNVQRLTTLSLAYRIYKDATYLNAVNKTLLWICNYPDWDPKHYLDTAEMSTAVAIAYDWLYDALPQTTKEVVKKCLHERAVVTVLREYEKGGPGSWAKRETNWNVVCNSGMTLAALAVAEDYPQEAAAVLDNAAKYLPNCLKHFAPDGVCYEGPAYWGYTLSYLSLYLKAVTDNGGDKGQIAQLSGMPKTALFYKRTLTPSGRIFNFGNAGKDPQNTPAFFLFSKLYRQPEVADWYRNKLKETLSSNEPLHQLFFLSLPWYDAASVADVAPIPSLEVYHNTINDILVFNGKRDKPGSLFLIAKGGEPMQAHQQLDGGTFIIESDSVCWTEDLGADDYSLPGFWDSKPGGKRWNIFRNSSLSHNTISIDRQMQYAAGKAFVCEERPDARKPSAQLNMTSLYKEQATSVFRKFTLVDDCTMEVEDEVTLVNPQSTVSWIVATQADVKVKGNKAYFTRNGKRFYMEIIAPARATFKTYPARNTSAKEYPIQGITMLEAECTYEGGKGRTIVRMSSNSR